MGNLKKRLRLFVNFCIILGLFLPFAQSQDFKLDDKKPMPIPTGFVKPSEAVSEAVSESAFIDGMKYYIIEEYSKALEIFEKSLKNNKENAGLNFQISACYLKLNKIEKAIQFAKKAYDVNNANLQYGEMIAGLYAKNGQFVEASIIYKKLFEKDLTNSELGLNLAATYYSMGKFDEVLKLYQIIEKNLGPSQELTNQKQQLLLKLNRPKDALQEGEKLIKADPLEIENYIDQAEMLIRNGKEKEAEEFINKALNISPNSGQAHILLADIARRKNDFTKMFEELTLACDDKNLESRALAKILFSFLEFLPENSDKVQKERLINKIIEIHPSEPRGYLLMGDHQFLQGNKKEANRNYLEAVKYEKNSNPVWLRILAIDNELAALKDQLIHSEQAIELYPNQSIFWYYNGAANFMLKNFDKATDALEEAKRLASDDKELILVINSLLGETYNRLKQHSKSDEAFDTVLKIDPKNDGVANNYSYYLGLRNEKLPYAIELASKIVERNPENSTYLDTYGWVLFVNKDYEKAKQYLEKAYKINNGKSGVIIEHYGDALFKIGEKDRAIELWKKAALLLTNNKDLEKKIAEGKIIE